MNEDWEEFCERLMWRFSKITHEDVVYKEGHEEETLNRIQGRLGKSREELLALMERMKLAS